MLKNYIAVIHTGGQDVNLLQDGKRCISFNYEKIIIYIIWLDFCSFSCCYFFFAFE
jgi:hypothetical protein